MGNPFLPCDYVYLKSAYRLCKADRADDAIKVMAAINGEGVDGSKTVMDIRAIVDSIKIEHAIGTEFRFKDLITSGSSQHRRRVILGVSS